MFASDAQQMAPALVQEILQVTCHWDTCIYLGDSPKKIEYNSLRLQERFYVQRIRLIFVFSVVDYNLLFDIAIKIN